MGQLEAEVTWTCTWNFFPPLSLFNVGCELGTRLTAQLLFVLFFLGMSTLTV
jgi:hypothetical protein